jgi:signal transduction histidine kinase
MVNNIMTRVSLNIDVIGARQHLDDDGKSRLDSIRGEIRRISDLVDRILMVTHLDNDSGEPFNLDEAVYTVVNAFEVQADALRVNCGTDGYVADADKQLIGMAIQELVANAVEATEKSDPRFVLIETEVEESGNLLVLTVTDNGPGIPDNIADRVFLPFVSTRFLGRGLGLAIAKQAAEACGGDIRWSRVAEATRFTLQIPGIPHR